MRSVIECVLVIAVACLPRGGGGGQGQAAGRGGGVDGTGDGATGHLAGNVPNVNPSVFANAVGGDITGACDASPPSSGAFQAI